MVAGTWLLLSIEYFHNTDDTVGRIDTHVRGNGSDVRTVWADEKLGSDERKLDLDFDAREFYSGRWVYDLYQTIFQENGHWGLVFEVFISIFRKKRIEVWRLEVFEKGCKVCILLFEFLLRCLRALRIS